MIVVGALVMVTAGVVFFTAHVRVNRLYASQREAKMHLLARTMSYGLRNLIISPGAGDEIANVADTVLSKVEAGDSSLTGCVIRDRAGDKVYSYASDISPALKTITVTEPIKSGQETIGTISITYIDASVFETEGMQQIASVGVTAASMVRYFLKNYDYFQIKFLVKKLVSENADVVYCEVTGADGMVIATAGDVPKTMGEMTRAAQRLVISDMRAVNGGDGVEIIAPVTDGASVLGYVRMGYSTARLQREFTHTGVVMTMLLAGVILLGFGIAVLYAQNITRPLERLTAIARSVGGDSDDSDIGRTENEIRQLTYDLTAFGGKLTRRGDEVGDLAAAYIVLVSRLEGFIARVKDFYQQMSITERLYAMGRLSAGIAHEINNPLTIISTHIQVMLRRNDLTPDMREDLQSIMEEIERIAERVRDLLSFTRDSASELATVELNGLVEKSISLCRYQFKKENITLITDFASGTPVYVNANAGKLKQLFLNLTLNAIHAMRDCDSRTLRVSVRAEGDEAIVTFHDNGIGIPAENISRIFDPFFTTKRAGEGTGLGLSICYNIAEAHGGRIAVESQQGAGTIFRVTIPTGQA